MQKVLKGKTNHHFCLQILVTFTQPGPEIVRKADLNQENLFSAFTLLHHKCQQQLLNISLSTF